MKKILFLLFMALSSLDANAQLQGKARVDSMTQALPRAAEDTNKVKLLYKIAWGFRTINPDEGLRYATQSMKLAQKLDWKKGIATVYNTIGTLHQDKSELDSAIHYITIARQIYEEIGDKRGISVCLGNAGGAYMIKGDLTAAADLLLKQQKILEEMHDPAVLSSCYTNLIGVYMNLGNLTKALGYAQKALKEAEAAGDQQTIARSLHNLGMMYARLDENDNALVYLKRAIALSESLGDNAAYYYGTIGSVYLAMNRYPEALESGTQAEEMAKKTGDKGQMANTVFFLGTIYLQIAKDSSGHLPPGISPDRKFNLNIAIGELRKAADLATEGDILPMLVEIYRDLSEAYKLSGKMGDAYESYVIYTKLRDSVSSNDNRVKISALETKRESELKEKQIEINKAQAKQKQEQLIFFLAGIALLLGIVFVIVRSNRKQKRTNAKLAEEKERSDTLAAELEELNAVKDKLFSAISHDLRSPLMTLDATLAVLRRENVTQEELKQYTGHISHSMNSTLGLLDNLLSWSLSQMKGLSLSPSEVKLKELVDENIELYAAAADKKKITLSSEVGDDQTVYIDKNVGRLVIRNLLNNAIKFTNENGNISVSAGNKNGQVEISVIDNGLGMATEHVKTLFQLRTGKTTQGTAREKGTGLGLVLCKELIEKSNGNISVESEPGKGSTFKVSVPATA